MSVNYESTEVPSQKLEVEGLVIDPSPNSSVPLIVTVHSFVFLRKSELHFSALHVLMDDFFCLYQCPWRVFFHPAIVFLLTLSFLFRKLYNPPSPRTSLPTNPPIATSTFPIYPSLLSAALDIPLHGNGPVAIATIYSSILFCCQNFKKDQLVMMSLRHAKHSRFLQSGQPVYVCLFINILMRHIVMWRIDPSLCSSGWKMKADLSHLPTLCGRAERRLDGEYK